jgi:hypothetical protein
MVQAASRRKKGCGKHFNARAAQTKKRASACQGRRQSNFRESMMQQKLIEIEFVRQFGYKSAVQRQKILCKS